MGRRAAPFGTLLAPPLPPSTDVPAPNSESRLFGIRSVPADPAMAALLRSDSESSSLTSPLAARGEGPLSARARPGVVRGASDLANSGHSLAGGAEHDVLREAEELADLDVEEVNGVDLDAADTELWHGETPGEDSPLRLPHGGAAAAVDQTGWGGDVAGALGKRKARGSSEVREFVLSDTESEGDGGDAVAPSSSPPRQPAGAAEDGGSARGGADGGPEGGDRAAAAETPEEIAAKRRRALDAFIADALRSTPRGGPRGGTSESSGVDGAGGRAEGRPEGGHAHHNGVLQRRGKWEARLRLPKSAHLLYLGRFSAREDAESAFISAVGKFEHLILDEEHQVRPVPPATPPRRGSVRRISTHNSTSPGRALGLSPTAAAALAEMDGQATTHPLMTVKRQGLKRCLITRHKKGLGRVKGMAFEMFEETNGTRLLVARVSTAKPMRILIFDAGASDGAHNGEQGGAPRGGGATRANPTDVGGILSGFGALDDKHPACVGVVRQVGSSTNPRFVLHTRLHARGSEFDGTTRGVTSGALQVAARSSAGADAARPTPTPSPRQRRKERKAKTGTVGDSVQVASIVDRRRLLGELRHTASGADLNQTASALALDSSVAGTGSDAASDVSAGGASARCRTDSVGSGSVGSPKHARTSVVDTASAPVLLVIDYVSTSGDRAKQRTVRVFAPPLDRTGLIAEDVALLDTDGSPVDAPSGGLGALSPSSAGAADGAEKQPLCLCSVSQFVADFANLSPSAARSAIAARSMQSRRLVAGTLRRHSALAGIGMDPLRPRSSSASSNAGNDVASAQVARIVGAAAQRRPLSAGGRVDSEPSIPRVPQVRYDGGRAIPDGLPNVFFSREGSRLALIDGSHEPGPGGLDGMVPAVCDFSSSLEVPWGASREVTPSVKTLQLLVQLPHHSEDGAPPSGRASVASSVSVPSVVASSAPAGGGGGGGGSSAATWRARAGSSAPSEASRASRRRSSSPPEPIAAETVAVPVSAGAVQPQEGTDQVESGGTPAEEGLVSLVDLDEDDDLDALLADVGATVPGRAPPRGTPRGPPPSLRATASRHNLGSAAAWANSSSSVEGSSGPSTPHGTESRPERPRSERNILSILPPSVVSGVESDDYNSEALEEAAAAAARLVASRGQAGTMDTAPLALGSGLRPASGGAPGAANEGAPGATGSGGGTRSGAAPLDAEQEVGAGNAAVAATPGKRVKASLTEAERREKKRKKKARTRRLRARRQERRERAAQRAGQSPGVAADAAIGDGARASEPRRSRSRSHSGAAVGSDAERRDVQPGPRGSRGTATGLPLPTPLPLVHGDVVLQFGRTSDGRFSVDFGRPLCPTQAFAVGLCQLAI